MWEDAANINGGKWVSPLFVTLLKNATKVSLCIVGSLLQLGISKSA